MNNTILLPVDAVLLLGPTGSGKSPLGELLSQHGLLGWSARHLDFGSALRSVVTDPFPRYIDSERAFIRDILERCALLEDDRFALARRIIPLLEGFRLPDTDTRRTDMTLGHVLTMTTGIRWDESTVTYTDPANSCANMEKSQDWIQFVLHQPMAAAPGSTFVYNSGATELLAYLIRKAPASTRTSTRPSISSRRSASPTPIGRRRRRGCRIRKAGSI